jgi:hypothetical protein
LPARTLRHERYLLWILLAVFLLYGLPTGHMHVLCFNEESQVKIQIDTSRLHHHGTYDHDCLDCHEDHALSRAHEATDIKADHDSCHECRCLHIPFQCTDQSEEPLFSSSCQSLDVSALNFQVACGFTPNLIGPTKEQPETPSADTACMRCQWRTISLLI